MRESANGVRCFPHKAGDSAVFAFYLHASSAVNAAL